MAISISTSSFTSCGPLLATHLPPALRTLALQHMIAGALAGIGEHVAMYPVDTVKTRMQALAHPGQQVGRRKAEGATAAQGAQ